MELGSKRCPRIRTVAVGALLGLVVAACGSRLPDDVLAEIDAARVSVRSSGEVAGARSIDGSVTGPDVAADGMPDSASDGGVTGSATAGGVTGGTTGNGTGGSTQAVSCRGGASAPGVSATEIKVASMVTASGPLPGATEGAYRGTAAYFAKVNAAGGICGRKITVIKGDDGLDTQRARAEFLRLEPGVLAFVGSLAVADSGYADLVAKTKVPYVGSFVDPSGRDAKNVFPRTLSGVAHTGPFAWYRKTFSNVKKVAFLYTDVGGVSANAPASREPIKRVGFDIVYDSAAGPTTPDYTSEVINMRQAGAQMVYLFAFEVNMHIRLARNMRQQNFEPELKVANIAYNSRLIDLLGDISNGWSNHIDYLPMLNEDEPARSPALREFITWNQRVFPGAQIDLFPVTAWSTAALFAEALQAVGPDVTRARVLAELEKIKITDGGGIRGLSDPSTGKSEGCFIIVQVKNKKWVRQYPSEGFECRLGEAFSYK